MDPLRQIEMTPKPEKILAHCLKINDTEARESFERSSMVLRQKDDTERMEA